MKRRDFFSRLAAGVAAAVVAPKVIELSPATAVQQVDSAGRLRGRVQLPNGDLVDYKVMASGSLDMRSWDDLMKASGGYNRE